MFGAVLPVRESIERAFLAAGAASVAFEPSLDQFDLAVINAALAAHGGSVTAEGHDPNGALQLRFAGRCVGCTLAEVTLRQGIEPLLGSAVVDVTDHRSGTNPFYAPTKR
jgi:Fe-S cluster biogenesis protein NfuA